MQNKESLSTKQRHMQKLTVGELKKLLNKPELKDSDEVFADYPGGWSGIFQVYIQDHALFMLASDNANDSGLGGGVKCIDYRIWQSKDVAD